MSKTPIALFLALLLGNAVILYSNLDWVWLRFPTALALTFVLPGWAWVSALNWLHTDDAIERIVLVIGFSSVLSALVLLIAVLLPGPFTETPTLIALNLATLSGLVYSLLGSILNRQSPAENSQQSIVNRQLSTEDDQRSIGNRQLAIENGQQSVVNHQLSTDNRKSKIVNRKSLVLFILLAIIAVAALTRVTRLGYAEFHEDELENMRFLVRAYKGEEYAPFLDSKGPIHWLLPGALWYLNGWVNEGIARTPFVIAAVLLVPLMFALGRRMSGGQDQVGLLAAGFITVNGFFVALARHVENRALIVFWGALAVWFIYRYYKENRPSFLLYTGLTLAIGLIAHPNVLLYLPVFVYFVWHKVRADQSARRQWPWLLAATLLFIALTCLFYVPYLLDPEIGLVYQYFAGERVGESLLYNLVWNIFVEDALYTTRYHAPVLVALLVWLLARHFSQWHWRGWALLTGLSAAIVSTVVAPDIWIIGSVNLAFVPYALLGLAFMLLPQTSVEIKAIFLWFSLPLGVLVFLAKDASNHIQMAYIGWALLAALALADLWQYLTGDGRPESAKPPFGTGARISGLRSPVSGLLRGAIVIVLALIISLIIFYQYLSFDALVTTYWQAKINSENNPNSIYNLLYGDIPRPRRAISNPRLAGWKAVGYLWANGGLSGDFRSINESFAVPIWYTFQTPRSCYDDPQNYWVRRDWKGWPDEEAGLIAQGYSLTRVILVDQTPMIHLFQKNVPPGEPEVLDMEAYRQMFDRQATPARFAADEPMTHPASANFGDKLLMQGYNLPQTTAHPGDLLPVTVYWESTALMTIRYRGFVHLLGPDDTLWGQHDDDPACRLLTTEMRPGQRSSRQFRIPIDPAIPPGDYRLVLGIYDPANFQRLPIWDNLANQSPGDSIVLGQVRINSQ